MGNIIGNYQLYLVTSQKHSQKETTLKIAQKAIAGGIDIIQLREKTLKEPEIIKLGRKLSTLCQKSNIVFIVNDNPYIAKEVNADGVHLGQEDIKRYPLKETKKILGKDKIVGLSTHSLEEVKKANSYGIDYIAFGPIFKTKTKNYFIGTVDIPKVLKISKFPVFFIGGINYHNIENLLKLGAKNIAMIREITQSNNISQKVKELKSIMSKYKDNKDAS
ncbi:MAG: thiamine phosphate synthase [Candidatus Omnitrophica bacterium]|jgi:thiamine-phosphate pyrophosphorylase|nr:thiamine phosphate synthase [Candidatus Omnitrophota bacterium]